MADSFLAKIKEHCYNIRNNHNNTDQKEQALLALIDAHSEHIGTLPDDGLDDYPLLWVVLRELCQLEIEDYESEGMKAPGFTTVDIDQRRVDIILKVAKVLIEHDPMHLKRANADSEMVLPKLLLWAEEQEEGQEGPAEDYVSLENVCLVCSVVFGLAELCPQALGWSDEGWSSDEGNPLVRLTKLCLSSTFFDDDDAEKVGKLRADLLQFFQRVGQLCPDVFLDDGLGKTVLHSIVPFGAEECVETTFWADMTLAVLEANVEATKTFETTEREELPLHTAARWCNEEKTEYLRVFRALHDANPDGILTPNYHGEFPINVHKCGISCQGSNWHIDTYIQSYNDNNDEKLSASLRNKANEEKEKEKEESNIVDCDGNALHQFFKEDIVFAQFLLLRLPPNHAMVTEYDASGVAPLHVLLRQKLNSSRSALLRVLSERHPEAIHCRTRETKLHPIQILISKSGPKQKNENIALFNDIYAMVRSDPDRTVLNMKGITEEPSGVASKKKKRRLCKY